MSSQNILGYSKGRHLTLPFDQHPETRFSNAGKNSDIPEASDSGKKIPLKGQKYGDAWCILIS
ncbi:MAG: hypothetical protein KZQ72_05145, partial [Candidatus Thiodiazotropha sp. (ex Cardiolucina cf. quadrata)]|nr:hypothetical protein [Candidatus Thiodiazotropha sp. (ex Cardiolucina cf. quadrata)]